jgi:hypothetical protein
MVKVFCGEMSSVVTLDARFFAIIRGRFLEGRAGLGLDSFDFSQQVTPDVTLFLELKAMCLPQLWFWAAFRLDMR